MTFAPVAIEGFDFALYEFVWDRTWGSPAVVVGTEGDKLTVAEVIGETRDLGRVAHRLPEHLCRYVKLIVPEDEAAAVQQIGLSDEAWDVELTGAFFDRLLKARVRRGLVDEG